MIDSPTCFTLGIAGRGIGRGPVGSFFGRDNSLGGPRWNDKTNGCPSWIHIEPFVSCQRQSSGASLRKSGRCGSPRDDPFVFIKGTGRLTLAPSPENAEIVTILLATLIGQAIGPPPPFVTRILLPKRP